MKGKTVMPDDNGVTKGNGRKRMMIAGTACALLVATCMGGALAYLTDSEAKANTFTVGEVKIDTLEPHYPGNGSDEVTDITPNTEIRKDPQVGNTGKNPAVVFMTVDIPMADCILAKDDGTRLPQANNELFDFRAETGAYTSINKGWVLLETTYLDKDLNVLDPDSICAGISKLDISKSAKEGSPVLRELTDEEKAALEAAPEGDTVTSRSTDYPAVARYCRRLYGYDHFIDEGERTQPVFDAVRMSNVIEGFVDNSVQNLVVTSYAIQAENVEYMTGNKQVEDLDKQTLSTIWQVYMRQSSGVVPSDGDTTNVITTNGGTLNVEMTVDNVHLYLNSGNAADAQTKAEVKVSYTGHSQVGGHAYRSSDERVATIDQNGDIKAIAPGKTNIICTVVNPDTGNEVTTKVEVTVLDVNGELVTK